MAQGPSTKGDYDTTWYERSSREYPDDETVANTEYAAENAARGSDKLTEYIARQRPGNPHAPLMNAKIPKPPPKQNAQGLWNYVEFIPEWTDPLWTDPVLEIEGSGAQERLVRPDNFLRFLRPAQLPMDQIKNPTEMARRCGVFPGRQDGRSRMTPTRSTFRNFAFEGIEQAGINGAYITQQAEDVARHLGLSGVDELLIEYSKLDARMPNPLSEREEYVLQRMREMQEDEDWQSLFFLGLNTNDLVSSGVFSLKNNHEMKLENDLHRYLLREKWASTVDRGTEEDFPRLVYQVGDRKGEWDPKTNDHLWERLQPALRLASRMLSFLEANDPFWKALLDIFNRMPVLFSRDGRTIGQREKHPPYTFSKTPITGVKPEISPSFYTICDPIKETEKVLNECVEIKIGSAYHEAGDNSRIPTSGLTYGQIFDDGHVGDKIIIMLAAETVYPLLVDGYSEDERLVAAYYLAITLVHEFGHVAHYAHYRWLVKPGPSKVDYLKDAAESNVYLEWIGTEIFGTGTGDLEPFFDQETRAELGYALENHLFGGQNWPLLSDCKTVAKHLYFMPFGILMTRWPTGLHARRPPTSRTKNDPASLILRTPPMVAANYSTCVQVSQIARFFTEEFWKTAVERYGSTAMRLNSVAPARIIPTINEDFITCIFDLLRGGDDIMFAAWPNNLGDTNPVVNKFLEVLTVEYLRLTVTTYKWKQDFQSWPLRYKTILNMVMQMQIICEEARISHTHEKALECNVAPDELASWEREVATNYRLNVMTHQSTFGYDGFQLPDKSAQLKPLQDLGAIDQAEFWEILDDIAKSSPSRLREVLVRAHGELQYEIHMVQDLYFDVFSLNDEERCKFASQKFITGKDGPWSRITLILRLQTKVLKVLKDLPSSEVSADIVKEYWPRFLSLQQLAKELQAWAKDLQNISPKNWDTLLPLIPSISNSRRPQSERLYKFAQREIDLMPAAEVQRIEEMVYRFKAHALPIAQRVSLDPKRNIEDFILDVETKLKGKFGDILEDEHDGPPGDPLSQVIQRRKMEKPDPNSGKRVKYTNPPSLRPPTLPHPPTITETSKVSLGFEYRIPKYSQTSIRKTNERERSRNAKDTNAFTNFTPMKFSEAKPFDFNFGSTSLPVLPAPEPMFGVQSTGPSSLGLFPAPYGLTASFTEDLQLEAKMREEAARAATEATTVQRIVANYRDAGLPTIEESPDTPVFQSRFKDPNEVTPSP